MVIGHDETAGVRGLNEGVRVARGAFAAVAAGLTIAFFLIGQAIQAGDRLILSQTFYLLACFFGACFVVSILPGRGTPPQK